jgi:hypothetical protein
MRRDWLTTRRVWITAVVLAALVIGGGGGIWLLRGFALRATYRAEPGKLTLGIEAGVVPSYQGMELPTARYMTDDVPPLLEIPKLRKGVGNRKRFSSINLPEIGSDTLSLPGSRRASHARRTEIRSGT